MSRSAALFILIAPLGSVLVVFVVAFLKVVPDVPPLVTLAIQRGELIDVRVVAPSKGEAWLRLHMVEGGQEVRVAVRHYDLLQKIADISAIRELSPGERLTLYSSEPHSFAGMGFDLPSVWQIDTNAGTVLSYAQSSEVWRTHRMHGFVGGSLLLGAYVAFVCFLVFSRRPEQARNSAGH